MTRQPTEFEVSCWYYAIIITILVFIVSTFFTIVAILNYALIEEIPCQIVDAMKTPGESESVDVRVSLDQNNSTFSTITVNLDCYCRREDIEGDFMTCKNDCLKSGLEYYREQIGQENSCDKHDRTISKILSAPELFLSEEPWKVNFGIGLAMFFSASTFALLVGLIACCLSV